MNKLFIILIVLLLLPTVNASYYNEIREQGKELGTPEEFYNGTWSNFERNTTRVGRGIW